MPVPILVSARALASWPIGPEIVSPAVEGLPAELTRCLADAEVEVVSWAGEAGELVLRVTKDIGPEAGLLRFGGVGHVNLPPVFDVAGLTTGPHPDGGWAVRLRLPLTTP